MKVKSTFENNQRIPEKYSCEGENINPELIIEEIPDNTKTIAIIVEDPDAPSKDWVHWVVWNIPVSSSNLKIEEEQEFEFQGRNDFGKINYIGPCPPRGLGLHRYVFRVYALSQELELRFGATKEELEKAMQDSILEKAEISGVYSRE